MTERMGASDKRMGASQNWLRESLGFDAGCLRDKNQNESRFFPHGPTTESMVSFKFTKR